MHYRTLPVFSPPSQFWHEMLWRGMAITRENCLIKLSHHIQEKKLFNLEAKGFMVWLPVTHLGMAISALFQRLAQAKLPKIESMSSLKPMSEYWYAHYVVSQRLFVIPPQHWPLQTSPNPSCQYRKDNTRSGLLGFSLPCQKFPYRVVGSTQHN